MYFVLSIGVYGFVLLPLGWNSAHDITTIFTNDSEYIRNIVGDWNYFALAMLMIMQFCVAIGVSSVPYLLMGEVFPFRYVDKIDGNRRFFFWKNAIFIDLQWMLKWFILKLFRTRAFYCGICGAINQVFAFVSAKMYYDFERWLSLPGVVLLYGILAVIGWVWLWVGDFDWFSQWKRDTFWL